MLSTNRTPFSLSRAISSLRSSATSVAAALGVSRNTLNRWRFGTGAMPADAVREFAELLVSANRSDVAAQFVTDFFGLNNLGFVLQPIEGPKGIPTRHLREHAQLDHIMLERCRAKLLRRKHAEGRA